MKPKKGTITGYIQQAQKLNHIRYITIDGRNINTWYRRIIMKEQYMQHKMAEVMQQSSPIPVINPVFNKRNYNMQGDEQGIKRKNNAAGLNYQ